MQEAKRERKKSGLERKEPVRGHDGAEDADISHNYLKNKNKDTWTGQTNERDGATQIRSAVGGRHTQEVEERERKRIIVSIFQCVT